jgi:hypothetical protein
MEIPFRGPGWRWNASSFWDEKKAPEKSGAFFY